MLLLGCDFSSSPSKRKPVVVALGSFEEQKGQKSPWGVRGQLQKCERFESLEAFEAWLNTEREPWVGGFDLPFGLPRELVQTLAWPTDWHACMAHYAALTRDEIRSHFKAFCDARPAGGKFAHRATDLPAQSSPSMKWVNPPVAFMLHAGVPILLRAGCHLPGLHPGNRARVALEAYPALLARAVVGNASYKSDAALKQTPERLIARRTIVTALETGAHPATGKALKWPMRLALSNAQREQLVQDASGDTLDAVLCMMQAAAALAQHKPTARIGFGLPAGMDALEGWITGVKL